MTRQIDYGRLLALGTLLAAAASAHAADAWLLGVLGYNESALAVATQYQGLTEYLGRALKRPVRVESVRSFEAFLANAAARRYQIMFAPPSVVLDAARAAGYQPIARVPGRLAAAFMAFASTGIAFPEDLRGKRIGFTARDSMITRLALAHLRAEGIDPERDLAKMAHFQDVDGVMTAMKAGIVDVGVANIGMYSVWSNQGHDLNLIAKSAGVPHLTFAVSPEIGAADRRVLLEALLQAGEKRLAMDFLRGSEAPGFEAAPMEDYAELARLLQLPF